MEHLAFTCLSVFSLACALGVVLSKNAINGAMCLLLCLAGVAGLFVQLHAYLLAFVLVLVYAGAVVALFLFIIMLLDLKAEERRKPNLVAYAGGGLVAVAFVAQLWLVLESFTAGHSPFPTIWLKDGQTSIDDVHNVGTTLFSVHNLPFQVVGVLILVATIGVVVLSKRKLK